MLASACSKFAKFLARTFHIVPSGNCPSTAVFPLPAPHPGIFAAQRNPKLSIAKWTQKIFQRALHCIVMALNFVHANMNAPPLEMLGRCPNLAQKKVFRHLRALSTACDLPGSFPLPPGRSGFEFVAHLIELERFASSKPEFNPDPYAGSGIKDPTPVAPVGRVGTEHSFRTHEEFTPIKPYRSLNAERLKLTGSGNWNMADHLDSILWLPFQEPMILQHGLPTSWDGPPLQFEDKGENLKLLKVWDAQGLLALFEGPHPLGFSCRVFNNFKNKTADRQIGDRRWFNGSEMHPRGPSAFLPAGSSLTSLSCPKGCLLAGCSSDRRDFYHQAAVSRARAFTNLMPFSFDPNLFADSPALACLQKEVSQRRTRETHGDDYEKVAQKSDRRKKITEVYGGFSSLFQGDHLGVEYALDSHAGALQAGGLLNDKETVYRNCPFPQGPVWQGLVIDDFFAVSLEDANSCSKPASVDRLETAEKIYEAENILGSDEKTVRGNNIFTIIGAEINSGSRARDAGVTTVAAPAGKRTALACLTLRIAALPVVTKSLAARLAGNWVSVLMFRRCLCTILSKIFSLGSKSASDGKDVVHLSRSVADELCLASILGLVAATDVSVPFLQEIFATDASMQKGAYVRKPVSAELSKTLWLGGDRKGTYTMLDSPPRACLRGLGEDVDDLQAEPALESPSKNPDFVFDAIEICGGSGVLSKALCSRGLVTSIPIDLSRSPHFNLEDLRLVEWIFHMIKTRRVKAVICEPPCTTFSIAQHPASRSFACPLGFDRKDRKTYLGNCLAFRCISILWYAWRHGIIALLEQPRLSKMSRLSAWQFLLRLGFSEAIIASCRFNSIHRKEFKFIGYGLDMTCLERPCLGGHKHVRIEGQYTKQSAVYRPELADFLAENLERAILLKEHEEADTRAVKGLESAVINDLLAQDGWSLGKVWEWKDTAHINVLESRAFEVLERDLLRGGGHCRFVCLLDSRVAKGAQSKGRSSARALRPCLNRCCAVSVAGNLHASLGFSPTRLNTADAPTRDRLLPSPACNSILDFLSGQQIIDLHACQLQRPHANWIRLFVLVLCCQPASAFPFGFSSAHPLICPGLQDVGFGLGLSFEILLVSSLAALAFLGIRRSSWIFIAFCLPITSTWTFLGSGTTGRLKPQRRNTRLALFVVLCFLCACSCHGMPLQPSGTEERERAARRSGVQLQADRIILQQTRSRREGLLAAFDVWLGENMRTTLNSLLDHGPADPEAVSEALVAYGKDMYNAGKSYGRFSETINAVSSRKPILRRQLAAAWDLAFNWCVDEPHEHNTALPLSVMLALTTLALLWGWSREAAIIVLGWSGVLRIGEILGAVRSDLVLPGEAAPGIWYALLKIQSPKTRGRSARHQSARIDSADAVELLSAVFGKVLPSERLWNFSPGTLRKRFSALQKALGLTSGGSKNTFPYSLSSLRPGGATHWLLVTEDAEYVRRKGRWISSRVLEIYLQESEYATFQQRLTDTAKRRIGHLCSSFPSVLQKVVFFKRCSIPEAAWQKLW